MTATLQRTPEPALMDEFEQAAAYASADFDGPHSLIVPLFERAFSGVELSGGVLDLGCGPGDVAFRFARRFPNISITAIDGSKEMISFALKAARREALLARRLLFRRCLVEEFEKPSKPFALILATSFLHHIEEPVNFWNEIRRLSSPGTRIFIFDLLRPGSVEEAAALVEEHAAEEPKILKRDFYNSLLAAFRPDEVEGQLKEAGLSGFEIEIVSDRHMMIYGMITG